MVRADLQSKQIFSYLRRKVIKVIFCPFVFPEARPGPPFHRVLPAGLYLQRDPSAHRETAQLPPERRPDVHLPCGPEM